MGIVALEDRASLDTRSELMKAKSRAKGKVNACPFGCTMQQLDDNGYCRHLVGFTTDRKTMEPLIRETKINPDNGERMLTGRRIVRPATRQVEDIVDYDDEGNPIKGKVRIPVPEPLQPGDKLVRITVSYRVYRDRDSSKAVKRVEFDEKTQADIDQEIREQFHIGTEETTLPAPPSEDFLTV
jgi:hypothetical protein